MAMPYGVKRFFDFAQNDDGRSLFLLENLSFNHNCTHPDRTKTGNAYEIAYYFTFLLIILKKNVQDFLAHSFDYVLLNQFNNSHTESVNNPFNPSENQYFSHLSPCHPRKATAFLRLPQRNMTKIQAFQNFQFAVVLVDI